MMYEHIVAKLREAYQDKDVSGFRKHFAIQFNVWGEGHGALYLEIKNGHAYVEPYEYFDRDTLISTDAQTLLGIAAGRIDPNNYFGDLYVEGDFYGLELLRDLSRKSADAAAEEEVEESTFNMEETELEKPAPKKRSGRKKAAKKAGDKAKTTEEPEGLAANVKERAEEAVDSVKEMAGEAVDTVKEKAEGAVDTVKEKAGEAVDTVKEKAEEAAKSVKRRTARKEKTEKADKSKTSGRKGRKKKDD